jgi:hypothetical protein
MPKTRPPLGVVPFEDRLAPAADVLILTPPDASTFVAAQVLLRHLAANPPAPDADGTAVFELSKVVDGQSVSLWKADRIDIPTKVPTKVPTKAPEATPVADPGPVTRDAGTRSDRDAGPVTESRGSSSNLGPVADAPQQVPISALTAQAETPAADQAQAAPTNDSSAPTTAGPAPVVASAPAAGRPLFASTDYVFLDPETAEPPQAEQPLPPSVPLEPDEPQVVPAVSVEPTPVAPEAEPASPLAGLLPFNVSDLEGTAHDLLTRVADLGSEIVEELGGGSEYTWLGIGALAAAGAVYASRPNRKARALTGANGYDSVFARWEGANAVIPPR